MAYNYIQFGTAKQLLAQRLYDPTNIFWKDAELGIYLVEALRTWNCLTAQWSADYTFTVSPSTPEWISLNTSGSPRQYTVQDSDLYTIIQYHLLEPVVGASPWTGTPQFSLTDLVQAYQNRQNEILQMTACNCEQLNPINLPPSNRRISLADDVLDVRRTRYVPASESVAPNVLWREDGAAWQYFSTAYRQTSQTPRNYSVSGQPPLSLDVDFPPNSVGILDILGIISGMPANVPSSVTLSIPNDWSWVLKWGMLADLLGKESESRDEMRMKYANARYNEGVKLMMTIPWLLGALQNNVPVAIEGVKEKDTYEAGWESNPSARQAIVVAGTDFFAISPQPSGNVGIGLNVVGNAPIPVADSDPVQVSRDVLDVILDYSFHLAVFKEGWDDVNNSMQLFDNFRQVASASSDHFNAEGPFRDVMQREGRREETTEPRFTGAQQ